MKFNKMLLLCCSTMFLGSCNSGNGGTNAKSSEHVHSWSLISNTATCTSGGTKTYSCPCGSRKTESSGAKGHTYGDDIKCSVCGSFKNGYDTVSISGSETSKTVSTGTKTFYSSNMSELAAGILSFTITADSSKLNVKFTGVIAKLTVFKVELYNDAGKSIASGGVTGTSRIAALSNDVSISEQISKNKTYYYKMSANG